MKDEITRLKFPKGNNPIPAYPLYITFTENDASEELDVVIYDTTAPEKGKPKDLRRFFFQINNGPISPVVFNAKSVVVGSIPAMSGLGVLPSGSSVAGAKAVFYQFPVSYEGLTEGNNTLTFYVESFSGFFTDPVEYPVVHMPQDDGPAVTAHQIGTLNLNALPDKNLVNVKLDRPGIEETPDKILWRAIKNHSLKFSEYEDFIDTILCKDPIGGPGGMARDRMKYRSPFIKSEEYNLIKFATEFFMLKKFGLSERELIGYVGNSGKLPYYDFVISTIKDQLKFDSLKGNFEGGNDCDKREEQRLFNPFMTELIWSYWMEQAGLVQTMNVINLRFQNIRTDVFSDRLQRFDADPLRPLSYILWGYIQDEQHRLSLPRRMNEYDHEYGLLLTGRAVGKLNTTDSRVKFLEAFHNLLNLAFIYFKECDDTTYIADAFPVLNALREVHLLLAEGNHNAYGNLTWTARQEMMMQQYVLARAEMREFLGGRVMVPYPETWMDRVDSMRNIQGWGETSVLHFYELAIHGEQILLSVRYGNWSDVTLDRATAANWALEFRNNIYRYIHAYRVVTGVDLTMDKIQSTSTFAIQPAYLIQQRLITEKNHGNPALQQRQQQQQQQQQRIISTRIKDRRM